jgi:transposase
MRAGYIQDYTALMNRTRGILAEFGVWLRRSPFALRQALEELQCDGRLPPLVHSLLAEVKVQLRELQQRIERCNIEIRVHAKRSDDAQRISAISGIGPITASAAVATISKASDFKNGRQMAAWIGLVPSQHSSGGQVRLGPITKRGDTYLRRLLVQGACSAMRAAQCKATEKRSRVEQWMVELAQRAGYRKALVGIANKHARIIWAILAKREPYDPQAWRRHPMAA